MSFMKPEIQHTTMWSVESSIGTELVPCELATYADQLSKYCEGIVDGDIEATKVTGWFARLSAPGYPDCTDWAGPFATKAKAKQYLDEIYHGEPDDDYVDRVEWKAARS
jgi:hypothetical protein